MSKRTLSPFRVIDASKCLICFNAKNSIVLAPCGHSNCCLSCYRRSLIRKCPICHTVVISITVKATGAQFPVNCRSKTSTRSLAVGTNSTRRMTNTICGTELHNIQRLRATATVAKRWETKSSRKYVSARRSARVKLNEPLQILPDTEHDAHVALMVYSGSKHVKLVHKDSCSSIEAKIAHNFQDLRHIHATGLNSSFNPELKGQSANLNNVSSFLSKSRRCMTTVHPEEFLPPPRVDVSFFPAQPSNNVLLIGQHHRITQALARKLLATFRPPIGHPLFFRLSPIILVDGEPVRVTTVENTPFSMRAELAARVSVHKPSLILLCADYFDVTSFEAAVRLDIDILNCLGFRCVWVLLKSQNGKTLTGRKIERVESSYITIARDFVSSERESVVVSVGQKEKQLKWSRNQKRARKSTRKGEIESFIVRSYSLQWLYSRLGNKRVMRLC